MDINHLNTTLASLDAPERLKFISSQFSEGVVFCFERQPAPKH